MWNNFGLHTVKCTIGLQFAVSALNYSSRLTILQIVCSVRQYTDFAKVLLFSKFHTFSRHRPNCDIIYAHKKSAAFLRHFRKAHNYTTALCADPLNRISPKLDNKCVKYGQKFNYAPSKVRLSLGRFTQKPCTLEFLQTSLIPQYK